MKIIKRDGSEQRFEKGKILNSLNSANESVSENEKISKNDITYITNKVADYFTKLDTQITVEDVQDKIEDELMALSPRPNKLIKHYIKYRFEHQQIRENSTLDAKIMSIVDLQNEIVKQENSNKNPVINSTQRDYIAGEYSRYKSENGLFPEDLILAHQNGEIHIHDTDYFIQHMHNCDLVDLESMLDNGTVISNTKIDSPHKFSTACTIATQIIAQVASNQYGGQSVSLTHLAKYVDASRVKFNKMIDDMGITDKDLKKQMLDKMLKDDITSGIQTLQYQIVTLMTTNGQAPFITLFAYLGEARDNKKLKADLKMVIEEVFNQRIQGVKNESGVWITVAFPKLIYVVEKDNIELNSKFFELTKLAAKCTAKRMVPDYISEKVLIEQKYPEDKLMKFKDRRDQWGDESVWGSNPFKNLTDQDCLILDGSVHYNPDIGKYELDSDGKIIQKKYKIDIKYILPIAYTCMGCRSFLTPDYIHYKHYGRFNQGVVTINLVDVACSSNKDEFEFWRIFDQRLEMCHRALRCRHERLLNTPSDVSPILWQHGSLARLAKGEVINKLLYDNYSTISLGYAGLYECVRFMTGKSHTDPEAKPFALKIMQKMNDKCSEWRSAENISYSLYGTPIESTTYKFAKCLKNKFGSIPEVTDHNYITNSYHVNVREEIDAFTKLKFESEFQVLSPGGAISYVEVPNMQNNISAVLSVIKYIYQNIMYAELNTKSDYCMECGYDGEIEIKEDDGKLIWCCPNCGNTDQSKMSVARRTCGYIGSNYWNQGRTQEIKDRVMHL